MSIDTNHGRNHRGLAILLALGAAVLFVHLLTGTRYGFHRDELATLDDATAPCMGLRRVSAGNSVLWAVIAEVVWNVADWIPIFCRGFNFGRDIFDRINGARAGWQDWFASARCFGGDSVRTRCRKSHAICFIRLFSMGRLFLFFHSVVQITRSTVVARNRRLHWFRHANQIQHAGLRACHRCRRAIHRSSHSSSKQMAMAWCRTLAVHLLAQPNLASSKRFRFARFSTAHPRTRRAHRPNEKFPPGSTGTDAVHIASGDTWLGFLLWIRKGTTFSRGRMFVRDSAGDFFVAKGRGYYLAPAYPVLYAGGAVFGAELIANVRPVPRILLRWLAWASVVTTIAFAAAYFVPIAPVDSDWARRAFKVNEDFREEIGWPELVQKLVQIRDSLGPAERSRFGILAGNYGEAGAINLYGKEYGLPEAICGTNSFWARGYGDPPPEIVDRDRIFSGIW